VKKTYVNVTDRRSGGQTDGATANGRMTYAYGGITALCIAARGKN